MIILHTEPLKKYFSRANVDRSNDVINNANVLTPDLSSSVSTESAQGEKPPALGSQSQSSSSSGSGSLNPGSSTASTVPVSPVLQSPAPPLLQDPILLRQLLPALQTALQLNNTSVDMAKINEGESPSVRVQRGATGECDKKKKKIQSIHRFTDDGTAVPFCLFCPVLTAAVTQASLQSMLHKILTAGPSAFNITTILSQAAQLSNQGKP